MVYENITALVDWELFVEKENLSKKQQEQFLKYIVMLFKANEKFNITRITKVNDVLLHHFSDSLVLSKFLNLSGFSGVADVGSGGGFPGIPLAILFPEVKVFLIEVTTKKIDFLKNVAKELELENIEVVLCDWRTFLRKTNHNINLFFGTSIVAGS